MVSVCDEGRQETKPSYHAQRACHQPFCQRQSEKDGEVKTCAKVY